MSKLTCPECNKEMHPICGNPKCVCITRIPEGEKPMTSREIGGITLEACPYCGFEHEGDWWADRDMEQSETETTHILPPQSLTGLSAAKDVINQEIKWCENNLGTSGKGEQFESGFLGGLSQALYLIDILQEAEGESPEGWKK